MSSSLILSNFLFCGLAAVLLLPLLRHPNVLIYKKGIPIIIIVIFILVKLLVPYEFSFTHTLASKNILPTVKVITNIHLIKNITVGKLFLWIWLLITMLLFIYIILNHRKLKRILCVVPETSNIELTNILSELCIQKGIKNKPKIIQLDIITSPFVIGFRKPIIALPSQLSKKDVSFILMHELEHLIHYHLFLKAIIEAVTIIYWWNPVVWILRREFIRALELQADANVIKGFSNKTSLTYLETLISVSRSISKRQNAKLSLSFALKSSMVEYRIRTILASNYFQKSKKSFLIHVWLLIFSTIFLLFSFIYTFESYSISPMMAKGTFTINAQTDYFVLQESNQYDLYVDGNYVITFDSIPEDLSNLPVHR